MEEEVDVTEVENFQPDVTVWGDINAFKLIFDIDNRDENYKRQVYGMEIEGMGSVLLMTGSVNESAYATGTYIAGVVIEDVLDSEGVVVARKVVKMG